MAATASGLERQVRGSGERGLIRHHSVPGVDASTGTRICHIKPESDIRFELWLPPRAGCNGKFEGVGSGASLGTIQYPALMRALVRGYATAATDNGHQSESGFDESWAMGQPERVVDFGYRAQHMVTQAAKTLTERFYGRAPRHSYFVGCSQGGHHALTEAQRFPEDYDRSEESRVGK